MWSMIIIFLYAYSFVQSFIQQALDTNYVLDPMLRAGEEAHGHLGGMQTTPCLTTCAQWWEGEFLAFLVFIPPKHRALEGGIFEFVPCFFIPLLCELGHIP